MQNRKILITSLVIMVVLATLLLVFLKVVCPSKQYSQLCPSELYGLHLPVAKQLSSQECVSQSGRIVNTLSEAQCNSQETNIGNVQGMRCPCICCVPKNKCPVGEVLRGCKRGLCCCPVGRTCD